MNLSPFSDRNLDVPPGTREPGEGEPTARTACFSQHRPRRQPTPRSQNTRGPTLGISEREGRGQLRTQVGLPAPLGPPATPTSGGWVGWAICPPDSRSLPGSAAPRTRLPRTWCSAGRNGQRPWPAALRKPVWPILGVTLPHIYAHPSASSLLFLGSTASCGLSGPSLRACTWAGRTCCVPMIPAGHTPHTNVNPKGRLTAGFSNSRDAPRRTRTPT